MGKARFGLVVVGLALAACARHSELVPLGDQIAAVRAPALTDPTPEDVDSLAARARQDLAAMAARNRKNAHWLGFSIGAANSIIKVGQYAGGGGAIWFGLDASQGNDNNKPAGRNAAYSGAVAAAVTMLEQGAKLDQKRAQATACRDVDVRANDMAARTRLWEFKRNNPDFRRDTLPAEYTAVLNDIRDLTKKCFE